MQKVQLFEDKFDKMLLSSVICHISMLLERDKVGSDAP